MPGSTSRLGLTYEQGGDLASGYPAREQANQTILDNATVYTEGAFVSRPSAGTKGRLYKATDVTTGGPNGTLYFDNGSSWEIVYMNSRGKSIIATSESRTNTSYGLLTTPDRVQSIVLPTDGLLCAAYQAQMKSSGAATGFAALFIGSNQVKVQANSELGPTVQEARTGPNTNVWNVLTTCGPGLLGMQSSTGADQGADVTTGQVLGAIDDGVNEIYYGVNGGTPTVPGGVPIGGACVIFAAAGTYDISVQFKASSPDNVTARNRKLWVWTLGF